MGIDGFLENYKTSNSSDATHTSMRGGKWNIPGKQINQLYNYIIHAYETGKTIVPLTESMGQYHPLVFDFDLKYDQELSESPITEPCLQKLTELLWTCIREVIHMEDESMFNDVYVMLKDKPYACAKGNYKFKDGIHYLYPKIILSRKVYKILCELIQEKQSELFELFRTECEIPPSNLNNTLFDGKFTRWMPYTCHKPGEKPYLVKQMYVMKEGVAEVQDKSLFEGETALYTPDIIIQQMSMCRDDLKENVEYSEWVENKLKHKSSQSSSTMVANNQSDDIYATYYVDNENVIHPFKIVEEEELKLLSQLCGCLSVERASEYGSWLEVGLALYNTNSDKLLPVWETFSKKYPRYRDGLTKRNCAKKWASFNQQQSGSRLTQGSLRYWANHDDREKFNRVMIDNLGSQIEKSISHGPDAHHLLALVIHKYYQNQFLCVDIADDWYVFDGTRWKSTLKANELKSRIHRDIYNIYSEYHNKYRIKADQEQDPDEQEKWSKKQAKCLKFMQKLLQENYVNTVIASLRHEFYEEGVGEKFDSDLSLLGVGNGVIDLKEYVFREGRPEDYLTKSLGYDIPIGDAELPIHLNDLRTHLRKMIRNFDRFDQDMCVFFQQIIPSDNVRNYTLRFLSKCLSGENRDEGFYIWTGSGGNGKSKVIELTNYTLGDYAGSLPVSLITRARSSSNSATPEMERTKGLRLVVMQEPEAEESINIGLMKELTGNDKIIARALFKEPVEFIPQFKMLLMCNDLPNVASNDDGTWRRMEVVDFVSRFVGEEDYDKLDDSKHVYKRDKTLREKLPAWKLCFLCTLLEEWMQYDKEGIVIPPEVNNKTKSYRNQNDVVGQWIQQCCEIAPNEVSDNGLELAPTSLNDLFYEFRSWCSEQGQRPPDKKKTKEDLFKWQEKTTYGLSVGRTKRDKRPNGTETYPLFNLKVLTEP